MKDSRGTFACFFGTAVHRKPGPLEFDHAIYGPPMPARLSFAGCARWCSVHWKPRPLECEHAVFGLG